MDRNRLLQRFLRYVKIDTTAQPDAEGYPSSAGQLDLGRLLVEELLALGVADARQNQHGIVMGTIPAAKVSPGADDCFVLPSWTPRRNPPARTSVRR